MEFLKKLFSPITATLSFIQNHFKAMVFVLVLYLIFTPSAEVAAPNNLQEIKLTGPIFMIDDILQEIQEAQDDDTIKGVLLNVNSPGGAVAPSVELSYAIKRLKTKKPVVVYASGTLASGSYYASIWADKIVANPGAMVGSIGVIMQGADLSGLMGKIGIKTQVVKAGKYKQVGTGDRQWSKAERAELNKVIKDTYNMFITDVADARGLQIKDHTKYADAHIFTAAQSKKVGLIDEVGVKYNAQKILQNLAGVHEPIWNKEDKFDTFMKKLTTSSLATLHTLYPEIGLR